MINNDAFITLIFDLRDVADQNDMAAVSAWLQRAGEVCTEEYEQTLICEELFNMGKPVNDALLAIAEGLPFLSGREIKLELMRLSKSLAEENITDAALKERIAAFGEIDGSDGDLREYIVMLLRACERFGAADSMPLLRAKLTDIGVI